MEFIGVDCLGDKLIVAAKECLLLGSSSNGAPALLLIES